MLRIILFLMVTFSKIQKQQVSFQEFKKSLWSKDVSVLFMK